ncbi:MAG: class I SAM-dependent methyltransferase [bacterium]|nr:class I SAM-dependent methyltransferase [bacterium]
MRTTAEQPKQHAELAARRFDKWAGSYGEDRISSWFRHYQSLAISSLSIERRGGFLDVGCGTGWAVRAAAQQLGGGPCAGIDISPRMIQKASAHEGSTKCDFRIADVHSIPFPDETFGSILCTCSFHHYAKPHDALVEIRRVLSNGGRFALVDSARDLSIPIWIQDRLRRHLEPSHVRYYTTRELRELLEGAGFEIIGKIRQFKRIMHHGKAFTGLMMAVCRK